MRAIAILVEGSFANDQSSRFSGTWFRSWGIEGARGDMTRIEGRDEIEPRFQYLCKASGKQRILPRPRDREVWTHHPCGEKRLELAKRCLEAHELKARICRSI